MAAQKHTGDQRAAPDWDRLRVVLAMRDGGSLSAAGRLLDVDHTTVARQLGALEKDLGGALFERSAAGVLATTLGEEVIAAAERMQEEVHGLLRRLDGAPSGPVGRVRLTATPYLVASLFAPSMRVFLDAHPGLQLELIGDNRSLDLSHREADIAVRMAHPTDPSLVAKRLGSLAFACYAATTDDRTFDTTDLLAYGDDSGGGLLEQFLLDLVPRERIVMRSNSMQALLVAVRAGAGCGLLPCFSAEGDPALRRVSTPRQMTPLPLWLVYHEDLRRSPRVRVAVSFVEEVVNNNRDALVPVTLGSTAS